MNTTGLCSLWIFVKEEVVGELVGGLYDLVIAQQAEVVACHPLLDVEGVHVSTRTKSGSSSLLVKGPYAMTASTRSFSRSNPARPYIWRLMVLSRLICPSTGPLLQGCVSAFLTAS